MSEARLNREDKSGPLLRTLQRLGTEWRLHTGMDVLRPDHMGKSYNGPRGIASRRGSIARPFGPVSKPSTLGVGIPFSWTRYV